MTGQPCSDDMKKAVARFLARSDIRGNLELLRRRLPDAAQLYVAGGAPRNVIIAALHGIAPPTRDIDIFIGGVDRVFSLSRMLKDQPTKPTDLQGIRWQPAGSDLAYDLSLLPDFFVIATYHLEPTLDNFLRSIDFTINAIAFDVHRQVLHDAGCAAAVRSRVIAFNSPWVPDKVLMAYRILLMHYKTGFRLDERVFSFLRYRLELEMVRRLKGLLRAKTGKTAAADIMAGYDGLCRYRTYDEYRAACCAAFPAEDLHRGPF